MMCESIVFSTDMERFRSFPMLTEILEFISNIFWRDLIQGTFQIVPFKLHIKKVVFRELPSSPTLENHCLATLLTYDCVWKERSNDGLRCRCASKAMLELVLDT